MSHPTQPSQPQSQHQSPYQQPSIGATATATPPDPRAARHAERERRRVERWRRKVERSRSFERFRNPRSTRMLLAIYLGSMAVAFAAMPLFLVFSRFGGPDGFFWPYVISVLISCTAWSILRCTIDIKDAAPDAALDEYEAEVLARWRRIGFQALQWTTLVAGFGMAIIGGWFPAVFPFDTALIIIGIALTLVVTVCSTLPAVGYALTFNASADSAPEPEPVD